MERATAATPAASRSGTSSPSDSRAADRPPRPPGPDEPTTLLERVGARLAARYLRVLNWEIRDLLDGAGERAREIRRLRHDLERREVTIRGLDKTGERIERLLTISGREHLLAEYGLAGAVEFVLWELACEKDRRSRRDFRLAGRFAMPPLTEEQAAAIRAEFERRHV